jgi:hypothetical protein
MIDSLGGAADASKACLDDFERKRRTLSQFAQGLTEDRKSGHRAGRGEPQALALLEPLPLFRRSQDHASVPLALYPQGRAQNCAPEAPPAAVPFEIRLASSRPK